MKTLDQEMKALDQTIQHFCDELESKVHSDEALLKNNVPSCVFGV